MFKKGYKYLTIERLCSILYIDSDKNILTFIETFAFTILFINVNKLDSMITIVRLVAIAVLIPLCFVEYKLIKRIVNNLKNNKDEKVNE